jgi:hypothetical protein
VGKPNQKPEFPPCGCTGWGKPSTSGYSLRFMIAVVDRMNAAPAIAEVKPEPEDDRHWERQVPDRPDFAREESITNDRGST